MLGNVCQILLGTRTQLASCFMAVMSARVTTSHDMDKGTSVLSGRRWTFAGTDLHFSDSCFVLLPSLYSVKKYDTNDYQVSSQMRRHTTQRFSTQTPLVAILPGCIHDSVYLTFILLKMVHIILKCLPTTSGVLFFATAIILGLLFKQETCILDSLA